MKTLGIFLSTIFQKDLLQMFGYFWSLLESDLYKIVVKKFEENCHLLCLCSFNWASCNFALFLTNFVLNSSTEWILTEAQSSCLLGWTGVGRGPQSTEPWHRNRSAARGCSVLWYLRDPVWSCGSCGSPAPVKPSHSFCMPLKNPAGEKCALCPLTYSQNISLVCPSLIPVLDLPKPWSSKSPELERLLGFRKGIFPVGKFLLWYFLWFW